MTAEVCSACNLQNFAKMLKPRVQAGATASCYYTCRYTLKLNTLGHFLKVENINVNLIALMIACVQAQLAGLGMKFGQRKSKSPM